MLQQLQEAIQKDPNIADAYFDLAEVLLHLDDEQEALRNYTKAIDTKPDEVAFYGPLAELYMNLGYNDEAEKVVREGLNFSPGETDKTIAQALQKDGVSVVGWDSLRYFWSEKPPAQTSRDLARVIEARAISLVRVRSRPGNDLRRTGARHHQEVQQIAPARPAQVSMAEAHNGAVAVVIARTPVPAAVIGVRAQLHGAERQRRAGLIGENVHRHIEARRIRQEYL